MIIATSVNFNLNNETFSIEHRKKKIKKKKEKKKREKSIITISIQYPQHWFPIFRELKKRRTNLNFLIFRFSTGNTSFHARTLIIRSIGARSIIFLVNRPENSRHPKISSFVKCIMTSTLARLGQWSPIISQFIVVVSSANNWIPKVRSIAFLPLAKSLLFLSFSRQNLANKSGEKAPSSPFCLNIGSSGQFPLDELE